MNNRPTTPPIKPNGAAYVALMEEWRTSGTARPGWRGSVRFRGFFGEYEIACGDARVRVALRRAGERETTVTLPAAESGNK